MTVTYWTISGMVVKTNLPAGPTGSTAITQDEYNAAIAAGYQATLEAAGVDSTTAGTLATTTTRPVGS